MCINHTCVTQYFLCGYLLGLLVPEDEGPTTLQNIRNYPPTDNITFQKTQILIVTDIPYSTNNLFSKHVTTLNISWYYFTPVKGKYSHAPCNNISVNDGLPT